MILQTQTYGKEAKHEAEVACARGGVVPALVVDLRDSPGPCPLDGLLAGAPLDPKAWYRPAEGWASAGGGGSGGDRKAIPENLPAFVVNFLISCASKTALYNVAAEEQFVATSNAAPRRASFIVPRDDDDDNDDNEGGGGGDDDGGGGGSGGSGGGGRERGSTHGGSGAGEGVGPTDGEGWGAPDPDEEAAFLRMQQGAPPDEEGVDEEEAFRRFQQESQEE